MSELAYKCLPLCSRADLRRRTRRSRHGPMIELRSVMAPSGCTASGSHSDRDKGVAVGSQAMRTPSRRSPLPRSPMARTRCSSRLRRRRHRVGGLSRTPLNGGRADAVTHEQTPAELPGWLPPGPVVFGPLDPPEIVQRDDWAPARPSTRSASGSSRASDNADKGHRHDAARPSTTASTDQSDECITNCGHPTTIAEQDPRSSRIQFGETRGSYRDSLGNDRAVVLGKGGLVAADPVRCRAAGQHHIIGPTPSMSGLMMCSPRSIGNRWKMAMNLVLGVQWHLLDPRVDRRAPLPVHTERRLDSVADH